MNKRQKRTETAGQDVRFFLFCGLQAFLPSTWQDTHINCPKQNIKFPKSML